MEPEILRTALAPSAECLSIEELGRYADRALGADEEAAAAMHVRGCLNCLAELALLRAVTSSDVRAAEAGIVRDGVALLEQRVAEIVGAERVGTSSRHPWPRTRLLPLAAVAAVLLVGSLATRHFLLVRPAPELPSGVTTGDEVVRSLAVGVRGPVGDLSEAPPRLEWLAVAQATGYRVRLMEVDRREVWSTTTSALAVDLPSSVRSSIVPRRTLLWEVTAYDASGAAIAESGRQSFRVVPR